jgi:hypothetical protein
MAKSYTVHTHDVKGKVSILTLEMSPEMERIFTEIDAFNEEVNMPRFRPDNTEGYSAADLAALNAAFDTIMAENAPTNGERSDDTAFKSWQDSVAERLLARYDAGERGESLTR